MRRKSGGSEFQGLRKFSVEVIAGVVASVLRGDEKVISKHDGPSVLAAIVCLPLDGRSGSGLRWTGRHDAVYIHSDFDSVANPSDHAGRVGPGACVPEISKVKLTIDFAFIKDVATGNIRRSSPAPVRELKTLL